MQLHLPVAQFKSLAVFLASSLLVSHPITSKFLIQVFLKA
jgi:hypothetical protein